MTTTPRTSWRTRITSVAASTRSVWDRLRLIAGWPRQAQPMEWIVAARARTITIAVMAAVAAAVAVTAVRPADADSRPVSTPVADAIAKAFAPVCTTDHHPVRICVPATETGLLPEMDRYAIRATQLDMVVGGVPPLLTADAVRDGEAGVRVDLDPDGDGWDRAVAIAQAIGAHDAIACTGLANSDAQELTETAATLRAWYATWLYGSRPDSLGEVVSAVGGGWDIDLLDEVTARPDAAQLDWAAATRHGLVTGSACP